MFANKKLRVGVVGLGKQVQENHLPAILKSRNVKLIAVCDIKVELVKAISARLGVNFYLQAEKMFNKEKLDLVIIAVPHSAYQSIVESAIKHKVHVIKEKPFAINLESAKKIVQMAEKNGVYILTTVQRRFNPIFNKTLKFLSQIGKISFFEGRYTFFTPDPDSGWRGQKKKAGGGCVIDMGYHIIDLIIWYFGLPDQVFAEMSFTAKEGNNYDAEDTALLTLKFNKNGFWGHIFISRVVPPKTEILRIVGTSGFIELQRDRLERFSSDGKSIEKIIIDKSYSSLFNDQMNCFIKIIMGEEKNVFTNGYHLRHMSIIKSAYESHLKRKYVNPYKFL